MKMKKMAALLTAGILCLGMSTTAFAAVSPTSGVAEIVGDKDKNSDIFGAGLDSKYLTPEGKKEAQAALDVLNDSEKLAAELQKAGYDTKGKDIVVMGAGMYEYDVYDEAKGEWVRSKFPSGGLDISFSLTNSSYGTLDKAKDLKHGDTVYVMHYLEDGTWEVIEATVEMRDGVPYVTVHMNSLSPVAFIKVMSNGEVVKLDPVTKKPVQAPKKASPKTGEF